MVKDELLSSVIHHWNCHLKPDSFLHRSHRVNKSRLSVIGLITFLCETLVEDLHTSVIYHWNHQPKPYLFPLRTHRVNLAQLSVIGLKGIF